MKILNPILPIMDTILGDLTSLQTEGKITHHHLPYTEGIRILQEAIAKGKKFEFPCEWGDDLAS